MAFISPNNNQKVDIVIPVYNAIDYVEACVSSLLKQIPEHINKIYLFDDASTTDSLVRLKKLRKNNIEIHSSPQNEGFGKTVNKCISLTTSDLVLVLNSDTEAKNNFLKPLLAAMEDPTLLAINPVPKETKKYDQFEQSQGYVKSYVLSGYAFLIRRRAFLDSGGFDPDFGRGYFEDDALARQLCLLNGYTGLCPLSVLPHHGSKSFHDEEIKELKKKNQIIFRKKFPATKRRVLIYLHNEKMALSHSLEQQSEQVCRDGGRVIFSGKNNYINKPSNCRIIKLRNGSINLISYLIRYIIRGYKRPNVRVTEIWLERDNRSAITAMFKFVASKYNLHLIFLE